MNKIILCTGADKKYLSNIHFKNYLKSINQNSNFDQNILVYVGDDNNGNVDAGYENINVCKISPDHIIALNPNNCIQHGEFIKADGFDSISGDDVIVFTDGDMTLQRPLSSEELEFLKNLKDGDVYVGYNASPNDTLHDEFYRLLPYKKHDEVFDIDLQKIDLKEIKVYNTGVLAMNKNTWAKLSGQYIELYHDNVDKIFKHYAKQQWLISFLLGIFNYNVIEMPYDIHNHTHYPSPIGTTIDENKVVRFNDKVVLFKHRWLD